MKISAIILARSGSKGIPKKNIIDFCGKPLIAWTIENCIEGGVDKVYVSSDSKEILEIGTHYGALPIQRPEEISGDIATSESGWLHALDLIEKEIGKLDWVLAPQTTSPLRTAKDIRNALEIVNSDQYDSLFSCSIAGDLFYWNKSNGFFESNNYDWKNRQRKQDFPVQYIENGSFYLFKPEIIRKYKNRFGGRIGIVEMNFWQMFEIDHPEDLRICEALMKEFIL
jgi:CMP-N,N'-diacetyllegionaminic acid synthase